MSAHIRAWEEPFLVGPTRTSQQNTDGINAALSAAYLKSMQVELPAGKIFTTGGITVKSGMRLWGAGTKDTYGTHLFLESGSNRDLLICGSPEPLPNGFMEMWHSGMVENIRLDGNKSGNTVGSCLTVYKLGETAELRRVWCENAPQYGFNIVNTNAPARMTHCVVMNNTTAGVRIEGGGLGVFTIDGISGDKNTTFLVVEKKSTVVVINPKVEGPHNVVFDLPNELMSFTVIGGYLNRWSRSTTQDATIFRVRSGGTSSARPNIVTLGMVQSHYDQVLRDEYAFSVVSTVGQLVQNLGMQ